jgi:hypothetical protein
MSPILGVIDSAKSGNLSVPSYNSIATFNGDGTTTEFTFSSIPQTYKHLQLRVYGTSQAAVSGDDPAWRFNGLLSGYAWAIAREAGGNSQNYSSSYNTGTMFLSYDAFQGANAGTTNTGSLVVDITDYTNTNRYKTVKSHGGRMLPGGGGHVSQGVGLITQLPAITSIYVGLRLRTGGYVALYGIK